MTRRVCSEGRLSEFLRGGDAAEQVAALVGPPRPKRKRGIATQKARAELEAFVTANDYSAMRPVHFVALWMRCHEKVYGVVPAEMDAQAWRGASSAAEKLLRVEFGGKVQGLVEFMRWVWKREQWRERRAQFDGEPRVSRIGWRLQFVQRHLLTDYRIDVARRSSG